MVPREGRGGGLSLFWKSSINLMVVGSRKYYIDTIIDRGSENEWHLIEFYGEPETARRSKAWEKLSISILNPKSLGYVLGTSMI